MRDEGGINRQMRKGRSSQRNRGRGLCVNKYELIAREYAGINALFHSNDPKVYLGHVTRSKPMSR